MTPLPASPSDWWWRAGAASGCAAVLLGAFGAHALRGRVAPELLKTWESGAQYHLVHSVALVVAGATGADAAGALFATGTALFSGSLYALVLTGRRGLGAITPFGGLALAAGWLALLWAAPRGAGGKQE